MSGFVAQCAWWQWHLFSAGNPSVDYGVVSGAHEVNRSSVYSVEVIRLEDKLSAESMAVDWADLRAALKGDGAAYGRLVNRYQNDIGTMMWRFSRDPTVHEELVQNVFVEGYLSLAQYRGTGPYLHWLRIVATRVGYRYWKEQTRVRARKTASLSEGWDLPQEAERDLSDTEEAERVFALLEQLPPRDRLVLTLIYLEERSVAEAAELCGWSQTMVKVQAFRARKKLQKLMQRMEETNPRSAGKNAVKTDEIE